MTRGAITTGSRRGCEANGDRLVALSSEIVEHIRLIREADLSYPIILSSDGRIMDGMHRVMKAVLEEREGIRAVQFDEDPEPDYVNVPAAELPY